MRLGEGAAALPGLLTSPPLFFSRPLPAATAPLTSTTWPPTRLVALCTCQTPAAGRCLRWSRWEWSKTWPRIWSWWREPATSACPTMTPAAGTAGKPSRPPSPTREVFYGFDYNSVLHCSLMEEELKMCRKRSNRSLGIHCGFMIAQLSLHEFKCILIGGFVLLSRFMIKILRCI